MKATGGKRAPHAKWTAPEVATIYACLGEPLFMANHPNYPAGQFPQERATAFSVSEGSDYQRLCSAIAERVLEEAGEANMHAKRTALSVAQKIQAMREHALATCGGGSTPGIGDGFGAFSVQVFHDDPKALPRRNEGSGAQAFIPPCADYVPPVRDTVQISFQARILNAHLACTLCKGYLQEACTIIECLHTFCKRCIKEHFKNSHHCPTCHKDLGAKPAELVRNDRTLQSLVDRLFPFAPEPDRAADRCSAEGAEAAQHGAHEPAAKRRARGEEQEEWISITLQEQPDTLHTLQLERPNIRAKSSMPIAQLHKFIMRHVHEGLDASLVLQIMCHEQLLKPDWTLGYAYREYWNNPLQDMVFTFAIAKREARKPTVMAAGVGAPAVGPTAQEGEEGGGEEGEEGEEEDEGEDAEQPAALQPAASSAAPAAPAGPSEPALAAPRSAHDHAHAAAAGEGRPAAVSAPPQPERAGKGA